MIFKRFVLVFIMLMIAILAVLVAAKYPRGSTTVSYEEPVGLIISLAMIVILFLPPLI